MEKKQKVLIVEDEKNIVDILRFNLRKEGYDTLEAFDGVTGLRLALEESPDLILLDLMLPEMNGFEVCKLLRDKGKNTPVLIITAREEEKDKILGLDLGADDYITKPFSVRELMARVKAHIRRVALIRQSAGNQEDRLDFGRPGDPQGECPGHQGRGETGAHPAGVRAAHLSGLPRRPGILPGRS